VLVRGGPKASFTGKWEQHLLMMANPRRGKDTFWELQRLSQDISTKKGPETKWYLRLWSISLLVVA
jgi:hypothetical protein